MSGAHTGPLFRRTSCRRSGAPTAFGSREILAPLGREELNRVIFIRLSARRSGASTSIAGTVPPCRKRTAPTTRRGPPRLSSCMFGAGCVMNTVTLTSDRSCSAEAPTPRPFSIHRSPDGCNGFFDKRWSGSLVILDDAIGEVVDDHGAGSMFLRTALRGLQL